MARDGFLEDFSSLFDLGTVLEDQQTLVTSSSSLFSSSGYHPPHSQQNHHRRPFTSPSLSSHSPSSIKSEIITMPRVVLTPYDTVEIIDDHLLSYYEDVPPSTAPSLFSLSSLSPTKKAPPSHHPPTRLNLSRGCGRDNRDTDHYVVPSLRLNYIDNIEYMEPIRDREKNWILDSQRAILNGDPAGKQERQKLVIPQPSRSSLLPLP
jgi:hypothetical protein